MVTDAKPPSWQVMCGNPLNGRKRGEHVIGCMASLAPNIHDDIVDLWDAVTPKLLTYLNGQSLLNIYIYIYIYITSS